MAVLSCSAHPSGERTDAGNLVGEATNILAADVLRANADSDKNFVFSPLGFSSILAMLSEGARGETAERIVAALHHPTDRIKGSATLGYPFQHSHIILTFVNSFEQFVLLTNLPLATCRATAP